MPLLRSCGMLLALLPLVWLPACRGGPACDPVRTAGPARGTDGPTLADEPARILIRLASDGGFSMRWPGDETAVPVSGDLGAGAEEASAAVARLRDVLVEIAARPGLREPDGASRLSVLVEGDGDVKWHHVQWIMQACADSDVRIYKMQFRARNRIE